jgi:hypothetical protein
LKEVDSDVEKRPRANWHGHRRNHLRRRRITKSAQSEDTEGPELSVADGEDIQHKRPAHAFRRPRPAARKQTPPTPKDDYGQEVNKDEV